MEKEVNELLKEKFLDQNKFTQDVEQLVLTTELNYIEALVSYCEDNNIEFESTSFDKEFLDLLCDLIVYENKFDKSTNLEGIFFHQFQVRVFLENHFQVAWA